MSKTNQVTEEQKNQAVVILQGKITEYQKQLQSIAEARQLIEKLNPLLAILETAVVKTEEFLKKRELPEAKATEEEIKAIKKTLHERKAERDEFKLTYDNVNKTIGEYEKDNMEPKLIKILFNINQAILNIKEGRCTSKGVLEIINFEKT